MISDETRAEWRNLTNAASEGPWWAAVQYGKKPTLAFGEGEQARALAVFGAAGRKQAGLDAKFAAAARTAMPLLLDEVDRLRAELDAASAVLDDTIVAPSTAKTLCSDMHTKPGMKGFYLCRLDPGHDGDHESGTKTWPADRLTAERED